MSEELERMASYGHQRLQQGKKATLIILVVVAILLLLCVCVVVGAIVLMILLGPTLGGFLGNFFVPVSP